MGVAGDSYFGFAEILAPTRYMVMVAGGYGIRPYDMGGRAIRESPLRYGSAGGYGIRPYGVYGNGCGRIWNPPLRDMR